MKKRPFLFFLRKIFLRVFDKERVRPLAALGICLESVSRVFKNDKIVFNSILLKLSRESVGVLYGNNVVERAVTDERRHGIFSDVGYRRGVSELFGVRFKISVFDFCT